MHLATMVLMVKMDYLVHMDLQELQDPPDLLELKEHLVKMEHMEHRVTMVHQEKMD